MQRIVILGAGIAGLSLASLLDDKKYNVTVYEKVKCKEDLGYFWKDDVEFELIKKIGLNFETSEEEIWNIFFASNLISYTTKNKNKGLIDRKKLSEKLYEKASVKAKIKFNSLAEVKDGNLKVNDKIIDNYDLLIDCRGCVKTNANQIFFTKRIILKKLSSNNSRNIFLKPCNINGIAWCNFYENYIDILIGQIGFLDEITIKKVLDFIHDKFNIDVIDKDNKIYKIPVRYPSNIFFKNKYVMLGDIVNMTIPITGSGINCTIDAAFILSEILNTNNIENKDIRNNLLWKYQAEYIKKHGVKALQIDLVKNWLLSTNINNLDFIIKRNILNSNDINNLMNGIFNYSYNKILILLKKPKLAFELINLIIKIINVNYLIKKIPKEYNEKEIKKWYKKINKLFNYNDKI